jgi:hypothetical protein
MTGSSQHDRKIADRNMAGGRKIVVNIQGETEKERRLCQIKEKTGRGKRLERVRKEKKRK